MWGSMDDAAEGPRRAAEGLGPLGTQLLPCPAPALPAPPRPAAPPSAPPPHLSGSSMPGRSSFSWLSANRVLFTSSRVGGTLTCTPAGGAAGSARPFASTQSWPTSARSTPTLRCSPPLTLLLRSPRQWRRTPSPPTGHGAAGIGGRTEGVTLCGRLAARGAAPHHPKPRAPAPCETTQASQARAWRRGRAGAPGGPGHAAIATCPACTCSRRPSAAGGGPPWRPCRPSWPAHWPR